MATKKECDRCKKQWNPDDTTRSYGENKDAELSTVSVHIPYSSIRGGGNQVDKSYELCQSCGRTVFRLLEEPPGEAIPK